MSRKIPDIRFKGFVDDWEQRKLGELASFSKGAGYTKGDLKATGKPIILYGRLYTKYETVIENVDTFVDEKEKSVISAGNEIIVPASGETSEDISRASVVAKPGIILGGDLNIVKPNTEIDPSFLALTISNGRQQKELSKKAQGKSVVHLHNSDLKEVTLVYPKKEEQTRIGNFFKNLDNTIALHQRKLTLLKQLKQTYLKQIFPQNKENMPALRFAGFSEPWKQSKFDEVFSHVQNNSLSRADLNYKSGYAMNIHYGDILIRFGEYLDVSKYQLPMIANKQLVEKYKSSILKDGDIVIADAAEDETVGKCSELGGIEDANILAGLHTIPSRPNWTFASGYLGYYMNSSAFHDQLLPLIQGTKISSISKSALKKTDIKYPHGKDEQTKIGNLFKQLDDSIALHQSKLEKLMDLKQVLLVKMFV